LQKHRTNRHARPIPNKPTPHGGTQWLSAPPVNHAKKLRPGSCLFRAGSMVFAKRRKSEEERRAQNQSSTNSMVVAYGPVYMSSRRNRNTCTRIEARDDTAQRHAAEMFICFLPSPDGSTKETAVQRRQHK